MRGLTDIFVRRPVLATVVSLLILLIGLRAFLSLPIRQYPELKNTVITVTTEYPGASPELMQGFITVPIAQAVAGPLPASGGGQRPDHLEEHRRHAGGDVHGLRQQRDDRRRDH
jgi:hypothetical protein